MTLTERYAPNLFRVYIAFIYILLLIPPLYLVYLSFFPSPSPIILVPEKFTLQNYEAFIADDSTRQALRTSIILSLLTAFASTAIGILGARAYLKVDEHLKSWLLLLYLLPMLIPGIILGLALVSYFKLLSIGVGLSTGVIAALLWTVPFSILITLTSMSNLKQVYRKASYDLGASSFYTFRRIEFPLIFPGVLGAFLFSFLLTLNEYVRTSFVLGREFTVPLLLFNSIQGGGVPPQLLAAATINILGTIIVFLIYIFVTQGGVDESR